MLNIYASLIAANQLKLDFYIKELAPYCAGFHLDIMDFHFVPNLTFGPDMVNAIAHATQKQLWVHLMVDEPRAYLAKLQLRTNDIISVHYESFKNHLALEMVLKDIKNMGCQASLALKPATQIDVIIPVVHLLDQVLIMSVEPGFSGQRFLPETLKKLATLTELRSQQNWGFAIGLDGGITRDTLAQIQQYPIADIVMGSALFQTPDPVTEIISVQQDKQLYCCE
jgi:Pentose-5-phosphate-3-epimerase